MEYLVGMESELRAVYHADIAVKADTREQF